MAKQIIVTGYGDNKVDDLQPITVRYTVGYLPKWYYMALDGDDSLLEEYLTEMAKTIWGDTALVEFGYNSAKTLHEIAVYGWTGSLVLNRAIELGYILNRIKEETQ